MKVLVVGSGGREHAIALKIKESQKVTKLFAAPGNAGIGQVAECVAIEATDIEGLLAFAKENQIDLTVVGPENPLTDGIVDTFEANGLAVFGPSQVAAEIEGSKVFSKALMRKYGIPSAEYAAFERAEAAMAYVQQCAYPLVVKADGLATGKGVFICENLESAQDAIHQTMVDKQFGDAGAQVVVEEFLVGREVSVLAFCDGKTVRPMTSARDYKRALDNDKGLNTGGMGTVSPCPYYTEDLARVCMESIFKPTMAAMAKEGRAFKGVLYFGLMLTATGPKVLEYNARFGDPETQVVLPRLKTDLVDIMLACVNGTLENIDIAWDDKAAVCVVLASGGYPGAFQKGLPISGVDTVTENTFVYHAATKMDGQNMVTSGGRVLGVTGLGADIAAARTAAYARAAHIHFENRHMRQDIASEESL